MTAPVLDAEPACPGSVKPPSRPVSEPAPAYAEARAFDSVPQATWDRLAARNPWSTPFSAWAFHRAWWDAYGDNAHGQTLVVWAIREGRQAAHAIDKFLMGKTDLPR